MYLLRITCLYLFLFGMNMQAYANVMLTEISGKQIDFNSLRGKWVMINYWASWCQPCLDEIRELNTFYHHNHKKVALFAVNYDGLPVQAQQQLIKKYHINYPSLRYDPSKLLELGGLVGVPATYVFNPQGQWVDTLYGGQTHDNLTKILLADY